MRKLLLLLLAALLLFSGCAKRPHTVFYENHSQIVDFGAVFGLAPVYTNEEEGVCFYYYIKDESLSFEAAAKGYNAVYKSLGLSGSGDSEHYSVFVGEETVFLTLLDLSDESGTTSFFVLMIGNRADFEGEQN